METLWFGIVAFMLAAYVIFDGFDLGTGVLHLWVARTDAERRVLLKSIGPVWDGNEVWLLAAGGALVLAFPTLYASSFSGFYLPLMMVLWLLILRAISLELRGHMPDGLWPALWDGVFFLSSALLCIFYGAALGNVVRGVPLDDSGQFFQALWSDAGREGRETGILDLFTISVGVTSLVALTLHGALWIRMKTVDALHRRSGRAAGIAWWAVVVLTAVVTALALRIQPQILENLRARPWGVVFPAMALVGLALVRAWRHHAAEIRPFLASATYLAGMLCSAAFGLYPYVLPAVNESNGLTVWNTAAGDYALRIALVWWIPGMILVAGYFWFVYRRTGGKIRLETPDQPAA